LTSPKRRKQSKVSKIRKGQSFPSNKTLDPLANREDQISQEPKK